MIESDMQKTIGYRVKLAREKMNLKQKDLAEKLKLKNRQIISSIENGKRNIRSEELIQLSEILNQNIEFFIDPFCVVEEAKFSWRTSSTIDEKTLNNFELKTGHLIGLLRWLRKNKCGTVNPLAFNLRLNKKSSLEDVRLSVERLIEKFDLGETPATNLIDFVENKLDIPVLFININQTLDENLIFGAACHLQDLGVILVNKNEHEVEQCYTIAHELFHILTWGEMKPDHRESNSYEERTRCNRTEELADHFASELLMTRNSLKKFISDININDIEYLTGIARKFKVSPTVLARWLNNLGWIDENTSVKLQREDLLPSVSPKSFSSDFVHLLHNAIDHGLLSARKAAKTINMNLAQLKELFAEYPPLTSPFDL